MKTNTHDTHEAALDESQRQAVQDLELAFGAQLIADGATAQELNEYCELIADGSTTVDQVRRAILVQFNATA